MRTRKKLREDAGRVYFLDMVGVTGSIPVAPTKNNNLQHTRVSRTANIRHMELKFGVLRQLGHDEPMGRKISTCVAFDSLSFTARH